jgi:hypothetical protein
VTKTIDPADLHRRFLYEPDTGHLIYRVRRGRQRRGTIAGAASAKNRAVEVHIDGTRFPITRVIWAMQTGEWPSLPIDHINRSWRDNRWRNLRAASVVENSANRSRPDGKSGLPRGVGKYGNRFGAYRSNIYLGMFGTAREAHIAYVLDCIEQYGEFAYLEDYVARGIYL